MIDSLLVSPRQQVGSRKYGRRERAGLRKATGWWLSIGSVLVVGFIAQAISDSTWTVTEVHSGSRFTAERDGERQSFLPAHVLAPES